MSIVVSCSCGKKFRAKDEHARKRATCPSCGQPVSIPDDGAGEQQSTAPHHRPHEAAQAAAEAQVQWWVHRNGQTNGPYDGEQIVGWLSDGTRYPSAPLFVRMAGKSGARCRRGLNWCPNCQTMC